MGVEIFGTSASCLVDTGASFSCLPTSFASGRPLEPSGLRLVTCNNNPIHVQGEMTINLGIPSLRRSFRWTFVVASVQEPLLGFDFLRHYKLIVDCGVGTLVDKTTGMVGAVTVAPKFETVPKLPVSSQVEKLLMDFPGLLKPVGAAYGSLNGKVAHHIDVGDAPPPFQRCRRLTGPKLDSARKEVESLVESGILVRSESSYATPIHMVPKPNGSFRMTGDYRALNAVTRPDRYPIPHLQSFNQHVAGATIFSKVDLKRAYHQLPVRKEDQEKTAITTPFGLFHYTTMPFGLRNAPATFQRFIDAALAGCESFAFWYLDDILIFSSNQQQHEEHLRRIFSRLQQHQLRLSLEKCEFYREELDFLGTHVSSQGLRPTEAHKEALQKFPLPKTTSDLRRFLGTLNFFRRFIPDFCESTFCLTDLLRGKNNDEIVWNKAAETQFQESKKLLLSAITLPHPSPSATALHLVTDASANCVGAALYQLVDGEPQPLGFYSKKLTDAQRAYSTFDRELLAAYRAVLHFRDTIEGRCVLLLTDHRPLVSALSNPQTGKSDRQSRHLTIVNDLVSSVEFIRGADNVVADCFSRVSAVHVETVDLDELARAQAVDDEIIASLPNFQPSLTPSGLTVYCDVSTPVPRPVVPKPLRAQVFHSLHDLYHPGVTASRRLVKARYFWSNLDKEVRELVQNCVNCQRVKIGRHTKAPLAEFSNMPTARFQFVHVDIVGPLPVASIDGVVFPYLLTAIDRATRWVEAIPLSKIDARSVADAFVSTWISRFGVPLTVVTDRGRQFESEFFQALGQAVGFARVRTTAYHPQSNGFVERVHRTLKAALRSKQASWIRSLPIVLLGLRAHPNTDNGLAPFTLVTGATVMVPQLTFPDADAPEQARKLAEEMDLVDFASIARGSDHSRPHSFVPPNLQSCTHVWQRVDRVRRPLEAPYQGPFKVVARTNKVFTLELPSGRTETVSVDRLKPLMELKAVSQRPRPQQSAEDHPDSEQYPPELVPIDHPRVTRSRRKVRFNKKNDYVYY